MEEFIRLRSPLAPYSCSVVPLANLLPEFLPFLRSAACRLRCHFTVPVLFAAVLSTFFCAAATASYASTASLDSSRAADSSNTSVLAPSHPRPIPEPQQELDRRAGGSVEVGSAAFQDHGVGFSQKWFPLISEDAPADSFSELREAAEEEEALSSETRVRVSLPREWWADDDTRQAVRSSVKLSRGRLWGAAVASTILATKKAQTQANNVIPSLSAS
ncbi:hypothetical protein BESB_010060 [Besnoitia besnoiti]|uniref:Transmembrane protein n=1 Tax=Besnoitia besnoiti TaxID=94643 RepID=A0A2A9MMR2_BESBE|nr:hypothetical protein BESB_010060 [Besnoitia besnoiti]PFH38664.1 hypothetical protein BESB_010060 [Besnoitia besnoiti]